MKRMVIKFLCIVLCVISAVLLCGCSENGNDGSGGGIRVTTIDVEAYYMDYNEVYELIESYNNGLSTCAEVNSTIINKTFDLYSGAGASTLWQLADAMISLSKVADDESLFEAYLKRNGGSSSSTRNQIEDILRYIYYGDNYYNESLTPVFAFFKSYNKVRLAIPNKETEIKSQINKLREQYGKNYENEIELLEDWFTECKTYWEEIYSISGESLVSYNSKINRFEQDLAKLANKADRY